MIWTATPGKDLATDTLEKKLWDAANQLWAGAGLKQSDYSEPILGLIFLRFAEVRFMARRAVLEKAGASARRGSKVDDPTAGGRSKIFRACGSEHHADANPGLPNPKRPPHPRPAAALATFEEGRAFTHARD